MDTWIGDCHLIRDDGGRRRDFQIRAVVLCTSHEEFDRLLQRHLNARGMHLLWTGNVHVAADWSARNGPDPAMTALAGLVDGDNRVALADDLPATAAETGPPVAAAVPEPGCLIIDEHRIAPLPDQAEIPFWDRDWIAPELRALLFGQPDSGDRLRTYLIVDASLRKKITGLFDLDSLDVPVRCLFKGDAAEDLKEVAPYLIDMTLPGGTSDDAGGVPVFVRNFFAKHWDKGTGIIVRSSADMEEIWRHFRKFTRYTGPDRKTYFFRFWETNSSYDYFTTVSGNPARARELFLTRQGSWITAIVSYAEKTDRLYAIHPVPALLAAARPSGKPFSVSPDEERALMRSILRFHAKAIQDRIMARHADRLGGMDPKFMEDTVFHAVVRMHSYGIYKIAYLEELAEAEIFLGPEYEKKDPRSGLQEIFDQPGHETDKFYKVMDRLSEMTGAHDVPDV